MSTSTRLVLPSPFFSTVVRSFSWEAVRRSGFRALSALAPERAVDAALRRFGDAPRGARSEAEWETLERAEHFVVPFASGRLAAWRWGPQDAPRVLLMHGWGGRGGQLRAFVAPLLDAGHAVVTFDAPGHGLSGGDHSSFVHFALALDEMVRRAGPVSAVIAHSMGAAVSAFAMARGTPIGRAVLIAPPASLTEFSRRFARQIGASEAVRHSMQRRMEYRYGLRWDEMEVERSLPALDRPGLVIHDADDREVPIAHGERYAAHWRGARLLCTSGLGHRQILHAAPVVAAAVRFASGGAAGAP